MMAGHRNRKNREALIRRSLMSGRPWLLHSCLHEANTSFSSLGKTLKSEIEIRFRNLQILINAYQSTSYSYLKVWTHRFF